MEVRKCEKKEKEKMVKKTTIKRFKALIVVYCIMATLSTDHLSIATIITHKSTHTCVTYSKIAQNTARFSIP